MSTNKNDSHNRCKDAIGSHHVYSITHRHSRRPGQYRSSSGGKTDWLGLQYYSTALPKSAKVFALIPEAMPLAESHDVLLAGTGGIAGIFSGLMDSMAGEKMSALLKASASLRSSGLSSEQITEAGKQVFLYIRERDPYLVDQLITAAPSIKGHFGL